MNPVFVILKPVFEMGCLTVLSHRKVQEDDCVPAWVTSGPRVGCGTWLCPQTPHPPALILQLTSLASLKGRDANSFE